MSVNIVNTSNDFSTAYLCCLVRLSFKILVVCLIAPQFQTLGQEKYELVTQTGHASSISDISFSPDGRWLASGGSDNTAKLWDVRSGAEVRTFTGGGESVAFSLDSRLLASGALDGTIRIWYVKTGDEYARLQGHKSYSVLAVRFIPGCDCLLSASADGTVLLWDLNKKLPARPPLTCEYREIKDLSVSQDGKLLALVSCNGGLKLWNIEKWADSDVMQIEGGFRGANGAVEFVPNSRFLITGVDGIQLWNIDTGERVKDLPVRHYREIWDLAVASNGHLIATGSWDRSAKLLDLSTGQERTFHIYNDRISSYSTNPDGSVPFIKNEHILSVAFTPDQSLIAAGGSEGTINIWDTKSGKQVRSLTGKIDEVDSVIFNPNGRWLASAGGGSDIELWDLINGHWSRSLGHRTIVDQNMSFSSDGRFLVARGSRVIRLWDIEAGKELPSPSGDVPSSYQLRVIASSKSVQRIASVSYDDAFIVTELPSGERIVSKSNEDTITVRELPSGREVRSFKVLQGDSIRTTLALSGDGRLLALGSRGRNSRGRYTYGVKLWDVLVGGEPGLLEGHDDRVSIIAISPDNKLVASGSWDKKVKLWDITTNTTKYTLQHSGNVEALDFSPDGRLLATGSWDTKIRLWDVATGRLLHVLSGHNWYVNSVAFSKDQKYLASAGKDGTTRLWDTNTGELLCTLISLRDGGGWLAVSPNGYFDGTADAMRQVSWRVGNTNEVVPLDAFYNTYFYPGLLAEIFEGKRPKPEVDISTTLRFPGLRTMARQGLAHIEQRDGKTYLCLAQDASPSTTENVRVRGEPIDLTKGFVKDPEDVRCAYRMELPKEGGPYELIGMTDGWKPRSEELTVPLALSSVDKSTLHVLTIGVDEYSRGYGPLRFPVADADEVEKFFREQKADHNKPFDDIRIWLGLRNENATRNNIRDQLAKMAKEVKDDDVVFLFIAGHGRVPVGQSMFYFIPYVSKPNDSWEVVPLDEREEGLSTAMLAEAVRNLPARRVVLVVDACQSGGAVESLGKIGEVKLEMERRKLAQEQSGARRNHEVGIYIMAAATPVQNAGEPTEASDSLRHGLLTTALLEALQGKGIKSRNSKVSVSDVMERVNRRVPELAAEVSKGKTKKWVQKSFAVSVGGADFPIGVK